MKEVLSYVLENQKLTKLVLSKSTDPGILRTTGRLVELKDGIFLALESFYADGKAIQKNIPLSQAAETVASLLPDRYKQLNIFTPNGDCQVKVSKKNKLTVLDNIPRDGEQAAVLRHDREKKHILPAGAPVDFLVALGVQDASGRIFDKKRAKFRQINRFLEMVADVESHLPKDRELYILDLCCGKSYLSFAVYYYFTKLRNCRVAMDCVDLKQDVIEFCADTASRLGYEGLHFMAGDIREFQPRRTPDLTVSLHACDIATDIVLVKAVDAGSKVILSTPCCHHEWMHQLKSAGAITDFILEHSILKQKFADAATDSLRCLLLRSRGYEVAALELIDPEETPKNVLIRGVKGKISPEESEKIKGQCREICRVLGVSPYLFREWLEE